MAALDLLDAWPVEHAAGGYLAGPDAEPVVAGDVHRAFRLASVTKLLTSLAVLVAVEEGSVDLDEPAVTMPEVTVRHLFAHAAGLPFEGTAPVAQPGRRRIYSNEGFVRLAGHLAERTAISFDAYLAEAVLHPLGMHGTELREGDPAAGAWAPLGDVLRLGRELLAPTVVSPATLAAAVTVQFPGLTGIVPGFGRQDPCDWGLGFELRDGKAPHWTPTTASPATFGHFGGAGTFLWVDPNAGVACAAVTDRDFDTWAIEAWPPFGDAVLAEVRAQPQSKKARARP